MSLEPASVHPCVNTFKHEYLLDQSTDRKFYLEHHWGGGKAVFFSLGELIIYPWPVSVVVVRSHFSNIFSSETAWPIKAKFYVEPPWVGGTKVCSRHLGHMTMMTATPIYGKNPSKIFFSRTGRPISIQFYVASGTPAHHSLFK